MGKANCRWCGRRKREVEEDASHECGVQGTRAGNADDDDGADADDG